MSDVWAQWLLDRRDGGSSDTRARTLRRLAPVRGRVLAGARATAGEVLLDVGCGDGMIGLAALEDVGPSGCVVFSDVSARLLEVCRAEVRRQGLLERATFVESAVETLENVDDASVDAVTSRSVLIYVREKQQAFEALRRVLRPGGRISLWEPINAHGFPEPEGHLHGFDLSAVLPLAARVRAVYELHQPPENDPMLDFDERDLIRLAEQAEFTSIRLTLEVEDRSPEPASDWDAFLGSSPNPLAPTWREAIGSALDGPERDEFLAHLRPLASAGKGSWRHAAAHLTATI